MTLVEYAQSVTLSDMKQTAQSELMKSQHRQQL